MMTAQFDTPDAFQAAVTALSPAPSQGLRARLLAARLDRRYQTHDSLALRPFADGSAYTGYVWDYLAEKEIVEEQEIWRRVRNVPSVYALSDLHSTERVSNPEYVTLPKGTVLRAQPDTVMRGLKYLPEDLYLCDDTCEWVGAFTHEWLDGRRFCVWSGRLPGARLTQHSE